ncbi:rust resistance kinase Lr10-like isoform X1 [Corylus avellana]|uniref:rust resistance kinase Lr10-like isoform X1 n=1 Tax=Corylus avellana TaxID=13451 RepID=UPI00286B2840|nr:rust resistance kinase Lr10-like isoform X1 [Corylus avellana]
MDFSYFLLFVAFIIDLGECQSNGCAELPCGAHGPVIRFPFRVNSQPEHCGYPGFHLSCTDTNDTVVELPNSVKLFVKRINYKSQVLQLYDPAHCIPKQLRRLNLSSSPFQFEEEYYSLSDFAFFNCSPRKVKFEFIRCLSSPNHQVYAFNEGYPFNEGYDLMNLPLSSCTKMYTLPSIPKTTVLGDDEKNLELQWSRPVCGHCEAKGKKCRLKKHSTELETECFLEGALSKFAITGITLGSLLLLLAIFALYRLYTYDKVEKEHQAKINKFLEDYRNFKPTRYSYVDIKRITSQFSEKLGEGAYGIVFKGKLSHEIYVAVKILNTSKGNGEEFINEVRTMGTIHHVNVVRLVGFCADGFRRALVYEFLPNDSLEKFISSTAAKNPILNLDKLQDISLGVAKGIEYLHQGCDQRILHFDIKPHNVLLDQNFNPKISDFGLAKLCAKDQSAVSMTTARGTMGYIAPEVFSRNFGNVSSKADVYSFGILLLEMVGGRKNVDITVENSGQIYFPEWIYNVLEQKEDIRIFVEDDGDAKIAKKLATVGLWCIQWHPMDRPSIKDVVKMLEGDEDKLIMPPNPFASAGHVKNNANILIERQNQELEVIPESE